MYSVPATASLHVAACLLTRWPGIGIFSWFFPPAAAMEGFFCTTSLEVTSGSKKEKKKKDIEDKRIEKRSWPVVHFVDPERTLRSISSLNALPLPDQGLPCYKYNRCCQLSSNMKIRQSMQTSYCRTGFGEGCAWGAVGEEGTTDGGFIFSQKSYKYSDFL